MIKNITPSNPIGRALRYCGLFRAMQVSLLMCVIGSSQAQLSTFDSSTNILMLDSVGVGGQYFSGVSVNLMPGQAWTIVGSPRQISPLTSSDSAQYANNQLTLPRTQIGSVTYDNFVLHLPVGSPMSIARMGVVSSATSPGYSTDIFPIRSKIKNSSETDNGGELTYALINGQVWKHFIDEPCMPAGIGTSDPDGYSDVEIYPNPGGSGSVAANEGNFRFVTYYPSKAEALLVETCIVTPVSGVFGVSQASSPNALAAAPTAITGAPGDRRNLTITGGTPPYTAIIDNIGLANFWFQPNGAELTLTLSHAGSGVLTIFDYNRFSVAVPITATGENFYPPSITGFTEGTEMDIFILFGSPPYTITNPLAPYMQVTAIGDPSTTNRFRLYLAGVPPNSGELDVGIRATDATGYSADFAISNFKSNPATRFYPASITGFTEGTEMDISVLFGSPPYAISNPLPQHIQVTPIGDPSTTNRFRLYLASVPPNSGSLNVGIRATDANGITAEFAISEFKANPIYGIQLTLNNGKAIKFNAGEAFDLSISGGRPPYTAGSNPSSKIFRSVTTVQNEWGEWVLRVKTRDDYIPPIYGGDSPTFMLIVRDANRNTVGIEATMNSVSGGAIYN